MIHVPYNHDDSIQNVDQLDSVQCSAKRISTHETNHMMLPEKIDSIWPLQPPTRGANLSNSGGWERSSSWFLGGQSHPRSSARIWSGSHEHDSSGILGVGRLKLSQERPSCLPRSGWRKNLNNTGFPKHLRDGTSDRRSIGEEEESEVGMIESRILSGKLPEADQDTSCFLNDLHHSNIFLEDSLWDREYFPGWGWSRDIVRNILRLGRTMNDIIVIRIGFTLGIFRIPEIVLIGTIWNWRIGILKALERFLRPLSGWICVIFVILRILTKSGWWRENWI
jgi:hypothetical protein